MTYSSDTIGVCTYVDEDGRWYGIRGWGGRYESLWKRLHADHHKLAEQRDDFPWAYVRFVHENYERAFLDLLESMNIEAHDTND